MENIVRKRISNFAKILIGLGLIIFLIFYVEPKEIYATYQKANKVYFLLAFFLLPINLYLQYFKWRIISQKYFRFKDTTKIWLSIFYGISGGIFTPMKSGEYFARALPYKNIKVLDVMLATLVDKLIPIFFVVFLGGSFSLLFLRNLIGFSYVTLIGLVIFYELLVIIPIFYLFGIGKKSAKLWNWLKSKKLFEKIISKVAFLKSMDRMTLLKLLFASFLYHLTFTFQMTLLLSAFSGEFNFIVFFFAANLIIFAQIIIPPIALGEVGVREGAAVYFLQNLGYSGAVGFSAAVSLFFINLLIPSLIGLILLLKRE